MCVYSGDRVHYCHAYADILYMKRKDWVLTQTMQLVVNKNNTAEPVLSSENKLKQKKS
jgi:hypothetical protein